MCSVHAGGARVGVRRSSLPALLKAQPEAPPDLPPALPKEAADKRDGPEYGADGVTEIVPPAARIIPGGINTIGDAKEVDHHNCGWQPFHFIYP